MGGRYNRFLPAPPASYPEFVQSHVSPWQAKYSLLPSCHHQFHPVGGQTGEVRTEFSGVSQLLPGSLTQCWGWSCDTHPSLCDTQPSLCDTHSSLRDTHSSLCETHLPHTPYHTISEQSLSSDLGPYDPVTQYLPSYSPPSSLQIPEVREWVKSALVIGQPHPSGSHIVLITFPNQTPCWTSTSTKLDFFSHFPRICFIRLSPLTVHPVCLLY